VCVCVCTYTYICTFVCTHKSYPPTHTQTGECDKFRKALHRQAETEGKNVFHMDELKQIASKLGIKGLDRVIESLNANQVLLVCAYTYALYMNVCMCACLRQRIFREVGLSHRIFQRQPSAASRCVYVCFRVYAYVHVCANVYECKHISMFSQRHTLQAWIESPRPSKPSKCCWYVRIRMRMCMFAQTYTLQSCINLSSPSTPTKCCWYVHSERMRMYMYTLMCMYMYMLKNWIEFSSPSDQMVLV